MPLTITAAAVIMLPKARLLCLNAINMLKEAVLCCKLTIDAWILDREGHTDIQ